MTNCLPTRHISAPKIFMIMAPSRSANSSRPRIPKNDAKADLVAAEEQLDTLGVDKNHPSPLSTSMRQLRGVIVAQIRHQCRCGRRHLFRILHRSSPSPTCLLSGSSAMSMKMTFPRSISDRKH